MLDAAVCFAYFYKKNYGRYFRQCNVEPFLNAQFYLFYRDFPSGLELCEVCTYCKTEAIQLE